MSRLDAAAQIGVIVIAAIMLFTALEVAQAVFAPVIVALVMGVVMSPLSDTMDKFGLPKSLAALSSLIVILIVLAGLFFFLEPTIQRSVDALPRILREVNDIVVDFRNEFRDIESAGEDVNEALGGEENTSSEEEGSDAKLPTVEDALWLAPSIISQIMIFTGTLFFFILSRDEIYGWIARRLVADEMRAEAALRLRAAERQVGRYFLTISAINGGHAVVISGLMMAIGMPSPILWGIAAGLLNYILYLGPAVMAGAFVLGGLLAFEGAYSFLPAALYISINMIEAQFVTPSIVGRTMSTNPLLIFLALVFFLWLWGPIGGIISIPLLLWVTVVSSDIRSFRKANPGVLNSSEHSAT